MKPTQSPIVYPIPPPEELRALSKENLRLSEQGAKILGHLVERLHERARDGGFYFDLSSLSGYWALPASQREAVAQELRKAGYWVQSHVVDWEKPPPASPLDSLSYWAIAQFVLLIVAFALCLYAAISS